MKVNDSTFLINMEFNKNGAIEKLLLKKDFAHVVKIINSYNIILIGISQMFQDISKPMQQNWELFFNTE